MSSVFADELGSLLGSVVQGVVVLAVVLCFALTGQKARWRKRLRRAVYAGTPNIDPWIRAAERSMATRMFRSGIFAAVFGCGYAVFVIIAVTSTPGHHVTGFKYFIPALLGQFAWLDVHRARAYLSAA